MAAVVISIALMLWASKPLTRFVSAHPTVVVLCLSFLLMIGLSLTAEGLGFKIPKGYLYAAIGFSILIEFFNQVARRSMLRNEAGLPLRDRTAEAVLRMLGGKPRQHAADEDARDEPGAPEPAFAAEERSMVSGVLTLGERAIRSIMTPRNEISWVDVEDEPAEILALLRSTPHSFIPVCRGELDTILGVVRAKDLMVHIMEKGRPENVPSLRQPIIVSELAGVLDAMETLRAAQGQLVLAADEYGVIQGLLTPIDLLEAIAGEFPDEDEQPAIQAMGEGRWRVQGGTDLHYLSQVLGADELDSGGAGYSSLAGLLLAHLGALPEAGATVDIGGYTFQVVELDGRRIAVVEVSRQAPA